MGSLPDDILNSILLELPVKSLLRFKSSCISWCCSINDPEFIKSHLHKSSANISRQKNLFFYVVQGKIPCSKSIKVLSTEASISADSKVVSLDETNIPGFHSDGYHFLQVSSCNGVVFIHHASNMMLWNPAIRKYKPIPKSHLLQQKSYCSWLKFGLAYDVVAEDYKVLCVHLVNRITNYPREIVEIYSVKNQSWRTINNFLPADFQLYFYHNPVSLNGVIHIMAGKGAESEHSVISFALSDENTIVTSLPSKCGQHSVLRALGDRICVIGSVGEEMSIWSLVKDGKTPLLNWNHIMKFPSLGSLIRKDVICVKEKGNILWRKCDGRFIEYNVQTNEYTEFNLKELPQNVGK